MQRARRGTGGMTDEAQLQEAARRTTTAGPAARAPARLLENWAGSRASSSRCSRTSTSARSARCTTASEAAATTSARGRAHHVKAAGGKGSPRRPEPAYDRSHKHHGKGHRLHGVRASWKRATSPSKRASRTTRNSSSAWTTDAGEGARARAAWTAARRSATTAARSTTSFRTSTTWCTGNDWQARASTVLHSTNNFPEFTGRICPAPCEAACTLNVNDDAGGHQVASSTRSSTAPGPRAGSQPRPAEAQDGQEGRGRGLRPAGLAAAQQLARAGHDVTVFEKNDRIGGLLRYGIPDFKMEKSHIDRRVDADEGGRRDLPHQRDGAARRAARAPRSPTGPRKPSPPSNCKDEFDAVVLTGGAEQPRDLPVPGPRPRRHALRDGVPAAAEQGQRRRQAEGPDCAPTASTSS